jgi:predicted CXXCH cytochrome family protein
MKNGSRAVKKLLLIGVGSALMVTMGGVGQASADGGPHRTTAVGAGATATMSVAGGSRCASCHRAHTAQGENLLKQAQPALCYSCHNGAGGDADVVDGVMSTTGTPQALRGGGFEYALIDGAGAAKTMGTTVGAHGLPVTAETVPVLGNPSLLGVTTAATAANTKVTSKHAIDGQTQGTIWGNGAVSATIVDPGKAGVTLECGSCHDPHGNGNYRILRPVPNDAGTAAVITSAAGVTPVTYGAGVVPVNIPDVPRYQADGVTKISKVYTTTNYWSVNNRQVPTTTGGPLAVAGDGTTDGFITNVAAWCTTCHTRYYAPSGSSGVNSGDKVFTYRHASARSDREGVSRPNCIQCHVAHGSNVAMGSTPASVPFPGQVGTGANGTLASTDAGYGDSKLLRVSDRGTCVMCHNV